MFRRKELLFIVLVQATITLVLSLATPNRGIIHPHLEDTASRTSFFQHTINLGVEQLSQEALLKRLLLHLFLPEGIEAFSGSCLR